MDPGRKQHQAAGCHCWRSQLARSLGQPAGSHTRSNGISMGPVNEGNVWSRLTCFSCILRSPPHRGDQALPSFPQPPTRVPSQLRRRILWLGDSQFCSGHQGMALAPWQNVVDPTRRTQSHDWRSRRPRPHNIQAAQTTTLHTRLHVFPPQPPRPKQATRRCSIRMHDHHFLLHREVRGVHCKNGQRF